MAKLAYNNTKNASIGNTLFELNCSYSNILYNEDVDPRSKSNLVDNLLAELTELMIICHFKPRNYALGNQIYPNLLRVTAGASLH